MLQGKRILLGVTASIAAYKAAMLLRLLVKAGAEVQVIMTPAAHDFITPLTLATLSKRPALTHFVKGDAGEWNNHVDLGLWADVMVVAPATADTLASAANGHCPNLLLATYLSARCPVLWCPAMDLDMYAHPATQHNLAKLTSYGNHVLEAGTGELASGLHGQGRLAEPEEIVAWLVDFFSKQVSQQTALKQLTGKHMVITAGPTHEPLDPVRFLGNHSSGKMGIALADLAAAAGAHVTLVLGPTSLRPTSVAVNVVTVQTAREMLAATEKLLSNTDLYIFAAAVADYRPKEVAPQKIKKSSEEPFVLELEQNPDIAATIGKQKGAGQKTIGFALETENGHAYAKRKMATKNLDLVVLNSPNVEGGAFGSDTNAATLIGPDWELEVPLTTKTKLASLILEKASAMFHTS